MLVALTVASAGCGGRNENEQGTPGDDPQTPAERKQAPETTTE